MACNSYKTLQLDFVEPDIPPSNGYLIKWRTVGSSSYNQLTSKNGSPIFIPNVPICQNIEGTIQADCGNGNFGSAINFAVSAEQGNCYTFVLSQTATYTYIPCGGSEETFVQNISGSPTTICALDGSVSGGYYQRQGICYN